MPAPRRQLSKAAQDIPWTELRRRSAIVYFWLQAGWSSLTPAEREQVGKLLVKSRGRPNRLTREEARTLGRLAGRAASAAATTRRLKR